MPDIGAISLEALVPTNPLHILKIFRYVSLLVIIFLVISPSDSGLMFLLLLGVTAVLIVADIYSNLIFSQRFSVFFIRLLAVALPIFLAGTGGDKNIRQVTGILAGLGVPGVLILLFVPGLDPTFA